MKAAKILKAQEREREIKLTSKRALRKKERSSEEKIAWYTIST